MNEKHWYNQQFHINVKMSSTTVVWKKWCLHLSTILGPS